MTNISSITTPIRFHFPDGSSQYFDNSTEAQQWFDQNYKDGYSVINYVPTQGDSEHPVELQEVTVTAKSPNIGNYRNTRNKDNHTITDWWNSIPRSLDRQWNNFLQTNPIFGQRRVDNYRRALQKNSSFSDNQDMASNIAEGVNIMSGGFLNRLSPTQNIGLIIDTAKGKNFINSWFGNSGIVSDNFAQQHPYLSFGINALGDYGIYRAPSVVRPVLQGVDRFGTRGLMNQEAPNTLNRLIGTGTSGYEDALSSGVVRGNPRVGPSANSLNKQIRVLKSAGVSDETIRNYASNNISEQEFNQLKGIFDSHYGSSTKQPGKISLKKTSPFEDYETYQQYLDDQVAPARLYIYSENPNKVITIKIHSGLILGMGIIWLRLLSLERICQITLGYSQEILECK